VEAQVEALLFTVYEDIPIRFRTCDVSKEIQFLKLGKARGFDYNRNEYLKHLPRRSLVHLTDLFNHCIRLDNFPELWKEAKIIILRKSGKDPKFPLN
jgi:hypothetical protein